MSVIKDTELLTSIAHNPDRAVRMILDDIAGDNPLEKSITDTSTPFFAALEFAATLGADTINRNRPIERRLYPANAVTAEDLNLHRSDADYVGVFATPATAWFVIGLGLDDVRNKAVAIPGTQSRKLTIPRNTQITVSEYAFNLHYPIDIYVGIHDSLTINYDLTEPSPIQQLNSNAVQWRITTIENQDIIMINVPMDQCRLKSYTLPADNSSGFRRTFSIDQRFFFCRVWHRNSGAWEPLETTFTDKVYNSSQVTAVISLEDGKVTVTIPQYYFNRNMVKSNIRVDVYDTYGELDLSFNDYSITEFVGDWRDYGSDDSSPYVAPIKLFETIFVTGTSALSGGRNNLSLEEQRDRVVWNSSSRSDTPITPGQLEQAGLINGFNIVKHVDMVTNRKFWATRELPPPNSIDGVSAVGSTMRLLAFDFQSLKDHDTVRDNGNRLTLLPSTLYELEHDELKLANVGLEASLRSLSPEDLASQLNSRSLYYSPFTYVLDITDNHFDTRVYDFTNSNFDSINFKAHNDTTGLIMTTHQYEIKKRDDDTGFILDIVTRGNGEWESLDINQYRAQLSYIVPGLNQRAFITADAISADDYHALTDRLVDEIEDGMVVFRFEIDTNFDVDKDNNLYVSSFKYVNEDTRLFPIPLELQLDLVYIVQDYWNTGIQNSVIDTLVYEQFLDSSIGTFIGVSHEQLDTRFGTHLSALWTQSRTIILPDEYLKYETDVIGKYSEDVYEMDPATDYKTRAYTYDPSTKKISFNLLHQAGDDMLDEDGNPIIIHKAGDTILDEAGNPIPKVSDRALLRHTDLFLLDGKYYFASSLTTANYRDTFTSTLVKWIDEDIPAIEDRLIEQQSTHIYYHPVQLAGLVEVMTDEGSIVRINAAQSVTIRATFTAADFGNLSLRESVRARIVDVINENFKKTTIDVSTIVEQARGRIGRDALGIEISGLFPESETGVVTLLNKSDRLTIGKRATALPDNTISVMDDVTFVPLRHSSDN